MKFALLLAMIALSLPAQKARVQPAPPVDMPGQVDSNSPGYWWDGSFHLLNSTGDGPVKSDGSDQFHLGAADPAVMRRLEPWPTWMESVWPDPVSGAIFGWYHREHFGLCPGSNLSVPEIGAAMSFDGGMSWLDMGAVITQGDPIDCSAQNGYFAGGTGDVNVMIDRENQYFYFFFGVYGGPLEGQGVGVARMPFANRYGPAGSVKKWYNGAWSEPGIGGRITPIFPAKVAWQDANTDAFWGPSIHWNTYLGEYVMLLNRSCCVPGFPQKGVYISFSPDLSNPASWSKPDKILTNVWWYPQVLGTGTRGTDRQAGRVARLYVYGHSEWEIVFRKPEESAETSTQQ